MVFVFTFLGEFGYELLNWQGVIRKFSRTLGPTDAIVCCSRASLYPIYEKADLYIDIGDVALFKHSRACCYHATIGIGSPARWVNRAFDAVLRASLRAFVRKQLAVVRPEWRRSPTHREMTFVFSSHKTDLRGCVFGCDPNRLEEDADIFSQLDPETNAYVRIEPDLRVRDQIEGLLGFDLSEPYVLVQDRAARVGSPQSVIIPKEELIDELARKVRVVLLSFETPRAFDSFSCFDPSLGCLQYQARSFPEQACLIEFARHCVFFSEGEFGSHTYVPPLMGHDVVAIAPRSVYALDTTTVDVWNRRVFRFGGQIMPKISEEVFASRPTLQVLVDEILSR